MTRLINPAGLAIIKSSEGLRLASYQDTGGVWTVGWGHTPATPGMHITTAQADALLAADIGWAEDAVFGATHAAPTTDNQFSAMVSLTFNIGAGGFRGSTVLRQHLAGNLDAAADAFLMWDKDNGKVVAGLSARRARERSLYLTPGQPAVPIPAPDIDIVGAIRALQTVLLAAGFYKGVVDDDPGPLTIAALRAYRASR